VKQPVANQDLWQALDRAAQPHLIEWHWVKGHAGSALNEEVDRLSVSMIPRAALPLAEAGAFHVFTAASCQGVSGPGAWAAVIRHGDSVRELSGREEKTSSNRLHLLAAVKGLVAVPEEATIHLYTASDYAAQGAEQWVKGWVKQDWRTKDGQPVKHRGLWQAIVDGSAKRRVRWHSLKAGVRPPEAQRAEALAKKRVG
ncbi:MAG: hypothetical protein HY259_15335, partial [Chloroflexi bacterium]|nr:hypothetical protein [Chloroflexota bacterium]